MTSAPFSLPATLDEIVTRNRDRWQIGLATAAEIAALAGALHAAPGEEKDLLADWRLIAIRDRHVGDATLILLADAARAGTSWSTSLVKAVDFERRMARTRNSIYALGDRGQDEPPLLHLLHLCATLHAWGVGATLGALKVFY